MGEAAVGVLEAVGSDRSVERPVGVGAAAARRDSERWTGGEGLELLVAVVLVAVDPDHPAFLDGRAWARSGPAVDGRAAGAGGRRRRIRRGGEPVPGRGPRRSRGG